MEASKVVLALEALAQESRLAIFRLLVAAGREGRSPGQIVEKTGLPAATLSFHLSQLKHSGLIDCKRNGRSLIYTANYDRMTGLVGFLTENCCGRGASFAPLCSPSSLKEKEKGNEAIPRSRRR
jgi:DNA-binding transcriptional ArsR family regulator